MKFYTYILKCADGSLYTGYTNDLDKRIQAHNEGTASKCTRGRLPVEMIYHEEFEDKSSAMKREYAIKKKSRKDKLDIIGSLKTK